MDLNIWRGEREWKSARDDLNKRLSQQHGSQQPGGDSRD